MLKFKDQELQEKLVRRYGKEAGTMKFYSFSSLEQNTKDQVDKIRIHPLVPREVQVSGVVYDVEERKLRRITG